jgi:hypothetical protein
MNAATKPAAMTAANNPDHLEADSEVGAALRQRVLAFFARQPDEELSAADISRKFGVGIRLVPEALVRAVVDGQLVYTNRAYSAGPRLPSTSGAPSLPMLVQTAAPATNTAAARAPAPRTPTPLIALHVEDGIPLAPPKQRGTASAYGNVFAAMEVGQSVLVPSTLAKRLYDIAKHSVKEQNGQFSCRQIDATNSRIWRTA